MVLYKTCISPPNRRKNKKTQIQGLTTLGYQCFNKSNVVFYNKFKTRDVVRKVYTRSIERIPEKSGTFWIKAVNVDGEGVTVYVGYSRNIYEAIRLEDKKCWMKNSTLCEFYVEVELDKEGK